jgi:hypothetical protein
MRKSRRSAVASSTSQLRGSPDSSVSVWNRAFSTPWNSPPSKMYPSGALPAGVRYSATEKNRAASNMPCTDRTSCVPGLGTPQECR